MDSKARPHPKPQRPRHFIKQWREYRGITQAQLAGRIGKTDGAISQLEAGLVNYTQPTLEAIADALSCTTYDLLRVDPSKEREVVDITMLLRQAPDDLRKQVLTVVEAMVKNGTNG